MTHEKPEEHEVRNANDSQRLPHVEEAARRRHATSEDQQPLFLSPGQESEIENALY